MRFWSNTRVQCACPDRDVETVRAIAHACGNASATRHGVGTSCERTHGARDTRADYIEFQGSETEARAWCVRVIDEHAPEWRRGTN